MIILVMVKVRDNFVLTKVMLRLSLHGLSRRAMIWIRLFYVGLVLGLFQLLFYRDLCPECLSLQFVELSHSFKAQISNTRVNHSITFKTLKK